MLEDFLHCKCIIACTTESTKTTKLTGGQLERNASDFLSNQTEGRYLMETIQEKSTNSTQNQKYHGQIGGH